MTRICEIFRTKKKEGMYLYVDKKEGVDNLPEALQQFFADKDSVMVLAIDENKKLANANAKEVLSQIEENGYYLQMPPHEANPFTE